MNYTASRLWWHAAVDFPGDIARTVNRACDRLSATQPARVFFRADDVAVPGRRFTQLIDMFTRHRVPLAMAVVPAWLSPPRWQQLKDITDRGRGLWCWHQHGWRHANHAPTGKKQEFGDSRPIDDIRDELENGHHRLASIIGRDFFPAFTPPWNRCGARALTCLADQGFVAVSRSDGSRPRTSRALTEVNVNLDLHTRKGAAPARDRRQLLCEMEAALTGGWCGVMIHHQRMNANALAFLDVLLESLKRCRRIHLAGLDELVVARRKGKTV